MEEYIRRTETCFKCPLGLICERDTEPCSDECYALFKQENEPLLPVLQMVAERRRADKINENFQIAGVCFAAIIALILFVEILLKCI